MRIEEARAILGTPTAESIAARFGCTLEQAKAGFIRTAARLRQIADSCDSYRAKGKTVYSGYPTTEAECARLRAMAADYERRAK